MKRINLKKLGLAALLTFAVVFIAYLVFNENFNFGPKIAHAAKTLHEDLDPDVSGVKWLFTVWKSCLALANIFVVIILIFLAAINILHIQYDTYAIKKSLPLLIMGIIMSNFSLLICRMIVDAANALALTFIQDPSRLTEGYLCALAFQNVGASASGYGLGQALLTGPALFIMLIFVFLIMIAILILAFLLWFRKTVIFILTAVSPIAFILYAFPPTQGLFKQWWGWFIRWAFMGPIVVFLMWFAAKIGENNCTSFQFSALLAAIGVTYLAAIMPFKLGGAVMGAWGNFGKKLSSPVTNAAKNEYDTRKKMAGMKLNRYLNESTPLGGMRAKRREELKTLEEQLKGSEALASSRLSPRLRGEHMLRRRRAQRGNEELEAQYMEMTNTIEAGERLEGLTDHDYARITGMRRPFDVAQEYMNVTNRINIAKSTLAKRRDIDPNLSSMQDLRDHDRVTEAMNADLQAALTAGTARHNVDGIQIDTYDPRGNRTGTEMVTYANAINYAADFRAHAKAASDPAEKENLIRIAERYEQAAQGFRAANANRYDYNRILDRNTAGRRYKESTPRMLDEAKTTYESTNGAGVVNDLDAPGTSEYRGDAPSSDRYLVGRADENTVTANFAVGQQLLAINMRMQDAVRHGDAEGLEATHLFVNRIQQAHNSQGTGRQYKQELVNNSLDAMGAANRTLMQDMIAQRAGHADWASMSAADQVTAMNNVDLRQLEVEGTGPEATAQREFLKRMVSGIHQDTNLNYRSNPVRPGTRVQPGHGQRRPRG